MLMTQTGNWADLLNIRHITQPRAVPQTGQGGCPGRSKGGLQSPPKSALGGCNRQVASQARVCKVLYNEPHRMEAKVNTVYGG